MTKFTRKIAISAIALIASVASAQASTILAAGFDLSRNTTQDAGIQVFSEQTGVVVGADSVTLDYLVGGNLNISDNATGVSTFSSGSFLTAGTYDSFLVHFDPIGAGSVDNIAVDFGSTIVGIIVSNAGTSQLLNLSDVIFGTAATYDDHIGRRAEDNDSFSLTNASTLTFSLSANANHIDNIRVLTEVPAVPLPAGGLLLLSALAGTAALKRRKKKRA